MSAPLRRRAFASLQVGGAFLELVLHVGVFRARERGAFVFALDLHHEERAARRRGRERLGDRDHLPGVFDAAGGDGALGGGQQTVGDPDQAGLGERVAGIELEGAAEQFHRVVPGRRREFAALQCGFGLRELIAESLLEGGRRRRGRSARRDFFRHLHDRLACGAQAIANGLFSRCRLGGGLGRRRWRRRDDRFGEWRRYDGCLFRGCDCRRLGFGHGFGARCLGRRTNYLRSGFRRGGLRIARTTSRTRCPRQPRRPPRQ